MLCYIVTSQSVAARRHYRDRLITDRIAISAITEGEILYGIARQPAARSIPFMRNFMADTERFPWDSQAAKAYGLIRAELARGGQPLGSNDLLIAAHAISLDAVLVTHDRALLRLESLCRVEDWATDL